MENLKSIQVIISGRVQNVGFRYATQEKAMELKIKGYVKNQPDGSVFIEAEAPEEKLNEFLIWCYSGPNWAKVINVKITDQPVCNYTSFEIKR